jgi:hypothetical protein
MYQSQLLALAPGEFVFSRHFLAYFFFLQRFFFFVMSFPKIKLPLPGDVDDVLCMLGNAGMPVLARLPEALVLGGGRGR